ncbi:MAG: family 10 glycosylhydrolase [Muribaculaceae bacterium]|nr:family 10 glycosylhydrolase [Muribaculaceae bacterium]
MRLNMKILLTALAVILSASWLQADNPKRELRSVWYTTVGSMDWPKTVGMGDSIQALQKQEMRDYLDKMKALNITSVCFQVRSESDAMYKSSYCPWSSYLTGERGLDPGWDPLTFCVEECHKRGMECWAWMNPYRWSRNSYKWDTEHDREMQRDGWLLSHDGKYVTLNPALDKCRKRIVDVCKEVVENYAVDGVLFDDYFYPNYIAQDSTAADYALYNVTSNGMSIGDWRRAHVNLMVKEVYEMIQALRPDVRFGISPAGVAGKAETSGARYADLKPCDVKAPDWQYATIFSDPVAWLDQKTIDFLSPQIYWATWHETAPYEPICEYWSRAAAYFGRHFYSSHTMGSANRRPAKGERPRSRKPDPSVFGEYVTQVELNRKYTKNNAPGSIFFGSRGLYARNAGEPAPGDTLKKHCYNTLALNPVITWKSAPNLGEVSNAVKKKGVLSWDKVEHGNSIVKYTIYAVPNKVSYADAMSADGDGLDAKYLLAISYDNKYQLPKNKRKNHWYAICVYDGYSNEFTPVKVGYRGK